MPLGVQAKLLRFLETRKFMRVGGSTKIVVDIRLVTATLKPIEDEVRAGRFRADLFYRIQGITLSVPPLRERLADIAPLVQQFVAQASSRHGTKPPQLARATLAAMLKYSWPGNIRELRNAVELLCLLREGKQARVVDLPRAIQSVAQTSKATPPPSVGSQDVIPIRLDQPLEGSIASILSAALDREGGNRSRAARRLSISLRTMQRHAARLSLPPDR
jgi:DNA-binding NtrC family response regulator